MSHLPTRTEYVEALNEELKQHPDYENGMEFRELHPGGNLLSFHDPRVDAFLNDEREFDFTLAPFEDAIKAYKDKHK